MKLRSTSLIICAFTYRNIFSHQFKDSSIASRLLRIETSAEDALIAIGFRNSSRRFDDAQWYGPLWPGFDDDEKVVGAAVADRLLDKTTGSTRQSLSVGREAVPNVVRRVGMDTDRRSKPLLFLEMAEAKRRAWSHGRSPCDRGALRNECDGP